MWDRSETVAEVKYIVFCLGDQKYGIELSRINGIEKLFSIVPVPVGPEYIKGIINLRNEVIPIYNLKSKLQIIPGPVSATAQTLIAETHDVKLGFEVDDILGIVPTDTKDIKEVPNVAMNEQTVFFENVIKVKFQESNKEEILLTINIDKLMTDSEFAQVAEAIEDSNDNNKEDEVEDIEDNIEESEIGDIEENNDTY